jgi:hypothetical protein
MDNQEYTTVNTWKLQGVKLNHTFPTKVHNGDEQGPDFDDLKILKK